VTARNPFIDNYRHRRRHLQKKPASITLLGLAALALAVGAYIWSCGPESAPAMPRTVTMTAGDYSLDAPDTQPEGAVTLRLLTGGTSFITSGWPGSKQERRRRTLLAALKMRAPLAGWVKDVGGPNVGGW